MFPIQQYFTTHRKPLPRVLAWSFRNPSKTKLGSQKGLGKTISRTNSTSDTMSTVEAPLTNGTGSAHINGNGSAQADGPSEPAIPFEPSVLRRYLQLLIPPLLGATEEDIETLFDDDFDERVTKFASEGGGAIYVVKKKEDTGGEYSSLLSPLSHFDA